MKILIICSKKFYTKISNIKDILEKMGHEVYLPNCYDKPETESELLKQGAKEHQQFKARMFKQSEEIIKEMDAVLVLNFDKQQNDDILKNYIGGATFLEMYDAFRNHKRIYLYNDIPESILYDEIQGFNPILINKDLSKVEA